MFYRRLVNIVIILFLYTITINNVENGQVVLWVNPIACWCVDLVCVFFKTGQKILLAKGAMGLTGFHSNLHIKYYIFIKELTRKVFMGQLDPTWCVLIRSEVT